MALGLKNFPKYGYMNLLKKKNHAFTVNATISCDKHSSAYAFVALKKANNSSDESKKNALHISSVKSYPSAPALPLPENMMQIFGNETARFNRERSRDITGPVLVCQSKIKESSLDSSVVYSNYENVFEGEFFNDFKDPRTESYDCTGAVSLNSSMQSNVPEPFSSEGKSTHLNMPGGESARDDKYIAQDMQNSHYSKVFFFKLVDDDNNNNRWAKSIDRKDRGGNVDIINGWWVKKNAHLNLYKNDSIMRYTTKADSIDGDSKSSKTRKESSKNIKDDDDNDVEKKLSPAKKLKRAVRDYGSTVVVFHVGLSLASLGISYLVISSGIDVPNLINSLGYFDDEKMKNILSNSSTFVIAYAVHKLFAPVRISITLATTPFLVRYLRKIGILKIK